MKQVYTLLILIASAGCLVAQTTEEEYNYITKGYKIQVESGLDMKKGYSLKDLFESSIKTGSIVRTTTFKGLYRTGATSPCAIMMIYQKSSSTAEYICIPHYSSEQSIWNMYQSKINTFVGEAGYQALALGLAKCAAYFSQNN